MALSFLNYAYPKGAILLEDNDHWAAPLVVGGFNHSELQRLLHLLLQFSHQLLRNTVGTLTNRLSVLEVYDMLHKCGLSWAGRE